MSNQAKYTEAFMQALDIEADKLPGLTYQSIPTWDSVGHMQLVAALEDTFDIMMDTDDIIDLNSFEAGKEILKKYDVVVDG